MRRLPAEGSAAGLPGVARLQAQNHRQSEIGAVERQPLFRLRSWCPAPPVRACH